MQRRAVTLARQNFNLNNGCPVRVNAARPRLMLRNREPSGRARREGHFGYDTRLDFSLDIVTVKMQRDRLFRTPTQFDDVTLLDPDQPLVGGQLAALYAQLKRQFDGLRAGNGKARRQDQRKRKKASEYERRDPCPGPHNPLHCFVLD